MKKRLLIAGLIGCFSLVVIGFAIRHFMDLKPPFIVSLDYPVDISVGDEFEMVIEIQNPTAKDHTLSYIHFGRILRRFELVSCLPEDIGKIEEMGFVTFHIEETLKAGASFDLTMQLKPIKAGRANVGFEVESLEMGTVYSPHKLLVTEPQ